MLKEIVHTESYKNKISEGRNLTRNKNNNHNNKCRMCEDRKGGV